MNSDSQPPSNRCTSLSPSGRRCRSLISPDHESFCLFHAHRDDPFDETEHRTPEAKAVVSQVLGTREQFKTATQVNEALAKLFALRARKLISQSDAYFLAYACQLMLFSLHSVKNDFTQTYELNQWEKLVERALRAHSASLPPLSQTNPSPKIIFQIPPASSDAVIPRSAATRTSAPPRAVGAENLSSPRELRVKNPSSEVAVDLAGDSENVAPGLSPAGASSTTGAVPLPPSSSLNRKQKRRPLAKTGREFASQVFDDLAASRAERKKRTLAHFGKSQQPSESIEEVEEVSEEIENVVEEEPEEGVEHAPAHW